VEELDHVVAACQHVQVYRDLLSSLSSNQSESRVDAAFFEQEVKLVREICVLVFFRFEKKENCRIAWLLWSRCITVCSMRM
jgi:hypothetical protein